MNLIVSVDSRWGIGREGRLLRPIPDDMKQFKAHTLGNVVVLGRLTLSTFPKGQPLPGRDNIILSRDPDYRVSGAAVAHSLPELLELLQPYEEERIYVIGGEAVYRLLLPYCHRAYVTRLEGDFAADRFFPDLDQAPGWQLAACAPPQAHEGTVYRFCTYANQSPQAWR